MEGEICDFCLEGRLESDHVREYYRVGKGLVVTDNVPAYVCNKCGERYYDAHVTKQMRKLSKRARQTKQRISFLLVRFEGTSKPRSANQSSPGVMLFRCSGCIPKDDEGIFFLVLIGRDLLEPETNRRAWRASRCNVKLRGRWDPA